VTLQKSELFLGDNEGRLLHVAFEAQQALEAGLQIVAAPDAAHAGDADVDVLQAQLVGHALSTVGGMLQGVGQDLRFDVLRDAVGMWAPRTAALLDERGNAADLERPADLIEGIAVVAHDAAGLGDVLQLLSKMQQ